MLNVIQPLPEQSRHVVIIQHVEDLSALLARSNQSHLSQPSQMMRDGGLADPDCLGKRANVHFALCQKRNQADTAWVAKRPEQLGDVAGCAVVKGSGSGSLALGRHLHEYILRYSDYTPVCCGCQPGPTLDG